MSNSDSDSASSEEITLAALNTNIHKTVTNAADDSSVDDDGSSSDGSDNKDVEVVQPKLTSDPPSYSSISRSDAEVIRYGKLPKYVDGLSSEIRLKMIPYVERQLQMITAKHEQAETLTDAGALGHMLHQR